MPTCRETWTLTPDEKWEDTDRKREEYFVFMLGNDLKARLFWAWLGVEAERMGYELPRVQA